VKRLVLLTFAVGHSVCAAGGAGPIDVFTRRWIGNVGGDTATVVAAQTGSPISGTGTFVNTDVNLTMPFTGISTPPDVNATFVAGGAGGESYQLTATYVTPDSVVGTLVLEPFPPLAVSLKRTVARHSALNCQIGQPVPRAKPVAVLRTGTLYYKVLRC
jgi:hypothetical protein